MPFWFAASCVACLLLRAAWGEAQSGLQRDDPRSGSRVSTPHQPGDLWAFRPIEDPSLPPVSDGVWCRAPIDHFILAKLEENGLRPADMADKRTLIRRASFDLIGLPPTPEEVDAFLADDSPDAFEKVVDRLLASPHYGERWARHWLDVARYGEDQAHSFKPRLYPNGFRYRDWVVSAMNDDMSYDRFIVEQLAGDLLDEPGRMERLPALGFLALGPVYYGDSKKLDQIDDRIDTLTRGLLGLTVACARCHDHKYDPIPTADYYALAGVIASTEYVEAPFAAPEAVAAYEQATAPIDAQAKMIDEFLTDESARLSRDMVSDDIACYMLAAGRLSIRKSDPAVSTATVAKEVELHAFILDAWVKYLSSPDKIGRPQLRRWAQLMERLDDETTQASCACPPCDAETRCKRPACEVADGSPNTDRPVGCRHDACEAAAAFQRYVGSLVKVRDAIDEHRVAVKANAPRRPASRSNEVPADVSQPASAAPAAPALDPSDAQLLDEILGPKGIFTIPKDKIESMLAAESKSKLTTMRAELDRLKKTAPPKYPVVHTLTDSASPTTMRVLVRGNPDMPGDEAPRRLLSALGSQPLTTGSGRLELAQALTSRDNPLTIRVIVNRVWQHLFGTGLVATPSNFGALGQQPTHPELLDHLASRFIAAGWSIKALHREIMLSATYQQSSHGGQPNSLDPANRLLSRQNRRRLEVEAWRDAMLAVSDTLDRTVGGPSISLASPDNRRRTLYAAISRHDLDPLLRLFDFPDPNITAAQRTLTTVPLQQLFVLNSEFMVRSARALAARLSSEPGDDATRIGRAILLVYGRPATDRELSLGLDFLARCSGDSPAERSAGGPPALKSTTGEPPVATVSPRPDDGLSPWEQYAQAILAANEFMFVD